MKKSCRFGKMQSNVLTPLQKEVLYYLFAHGFADLGFYFTGGTALCEFYIPYRKSVDLDFFVSSKDLLPSMDQVVNIVSGLPYPFTITKSSPDHAEIIIEPNQLLLHFNIHPHPNIEPPNTFGNIVVDSLKDIAVNKVTCLMGRDEPKDAYDLYSILQDTNFTFDALAEYAKEKDGAFDDKHNVVILGSKFIDYPTGPISDKLFLGEILPLKKIQDFYRELGKKIIKRYQTE